MIFRFYRSEKLWFSSKLEFNYIFINLNNRNNKKLSFGEEIRIKIKIKENGGISKN